MYTTFETTLRNGRAACRSQSGAAGSSGNCRRSLQVEKGANTKEHEEFIFMLLVYLK